MPLSEPGQSDVRRGERWTRRQRLKNDLIYGALRVLFYVADRLPARWLLALCAALGAAAHALLWSERTRARERLRLVRDDERWARRSAARTFRNAGLNLGRSLLLRRPAFRAATHVRLDESTRALLQATLAEGRGAIFVSAHLGPFEWLAAALAEAGFEPAIVVRESYDPRLNALVDRHRLERGIKVVHRGRASAALAIVRTLEAGRPLGFLPDLGGRVPSTSVSWLGRTQLRLATGPQRLALRTGAPLLVGVLVPDRDARARSRSEREIPGLFRVRLTRITGASEADLTQGVAEALADGIAAALDEWLWMAAPVSVRVGQTTTPSGQIARVSAFEHARAHPRGE